MKLIIGLALGLFVGAFAAYQYLISVKVADAAGYMFASFGGMAGIVGAACYFIRSHYEHKLKQASTDYEYKLGILTEKLKLRDSKTYQLRTDAIAEVHGRLIDLYDATYEFPSTGGSEPAGSEKWLEAVERIRVARNAFIDTMARRGLYLPEELAAATRKLSGNFYGHHVRLTMLKEHPDETRSAEVKAWCDENEQIPLRLKELEKQFTKTLGFID
jgi:hypothetical protein